MEIHRGFQSFPMLRHTVVTSGTFDGVHLGHQKILRRIVEVAQKQSGQTVLITFWPHPRMVLQKNTNPLKLLTTIEEKAELLADIGIDHLLIIPFTPEFSELSPEEFIQKIYIEAVNTKCLVIGYDHHFGKNRAGNFKYLQNNYQDLGFEIEEIKKHDIDHVAVSSTKIRNALFAGKVEEATHYLGRYYSISGKVLHGDKIGRELGFPTANIGKLEDYKLIPKEGIYAVWVTVKDEKYQGMLYIGNRPTLEKKFQNRIEVNILNFEQDIYDEQIKVEFVSKIRDDMKFEGLEQMKKQLKADEQNTFEVFSSLTNTF